MTFTEKEMLSINKTGWNTVAHQFFEGSFEDLEYGLHSPTEAELNLLEEVKGQVILEVGCGSGHTLEYLANRGAKQLWGVDLSSKQIETAKEVVSGFDIPIHFVESPMEEMTGLPNNYFDTAVSIYALGWTVNLEKTLTNIFRALKPGGIFVFSWEHPIHSLVECDEEGRLYFRLSYTSEQTEMHDSWRSVPIVMNYRSMSTYINTLINTGFVIDRVVEEVVIDETCTSKWYSIDKAKMIPPSFTIKCHKS